MKDRTASQAYREQIAAVRANLTAIGDALEAHIAETGAKVHWGHVGDLGHLNEILTQARQFIRNEEE